MITGSSTSNTLPVHKHRRRKQEKLIILCVAVLVCFSWTVSVWLGWVAHSALPDPRSFFFKVTGTEQQQHPKHPKSTLLHHDKNKNSSGITAQASPIGLQPATLAASTKRRKTGNLPLVECILSTPRQSADTAASGVITITVRSDLSPIASNVFLQLVESHFYDEVFIFRVLPNFIAQWGVRRDPWPEAEPSKMVDAIDNNKTLSNRRGTLSFVGGNPVTRQVFVNLNDVNVRLDKEGSRPFATVDEASMLLLDQLYGGYKDGQGQIQTLKKGPDAMLEQFPHMSRMNQCRVVAQ
eukprot:scaffold12434_cov177-Amphora_coffeaeformis.AAC.7